MAEKTHLRCYPLGSSRRQPPKHLLLFFLFLIQRDLWRGAANVALLVICSGFAAARCLFQGTSRWWWLPLQLLFMPGLMALEEYFHALVALHKGLPPGRLELVIICRRGAAGLCWLCQGAAIRIRGSLPPADRIQVSAPGPLLNALLAMLLWTTCAILDRDFLWGRAHQVFLPMTAYFLSTFMSAQALPNDVSNILMARHEAEYDWIGTCRVYWRGIVLLFSEPGKYEVGQTGS